MLKITCCPLQWWQLNNSTRGPSEKINTHQIAKMWMQFVGKVDLMQACAGCQHGVSSQGGLKHVEAPIPRVRLVPTWPGRVCLPRAPNKLACEVTWTTGPGLPRSAAAVAAVTLAHKHVSAQREVSSCLVIQTLRIFLKFHPRSPLCFLCHILENKNKNKTYLLV